MTHADLAAGLREHQLEQFNDPLYAEALVAASDWHVIRSYVRRSGRNLRPDSIECLADEAKSTEDFIGIIEHGLYHRKGRNT